MIEVPTKNVKPNGPRRASTMSATATFKTSITTTAIVAVPAAASAFETSGNKIC